MRARLPLGSHNDEAFKVMSEEPLGNREVGNLLDCFDAFVAAPAHIVCDECNELIPLDELGFNYDHNCLEPFVAAPAHMVCDQCNELIPLDGLGFNYDHDCIDRARFDKSKVH